jgi:hypothetical protein
MYPEVTLNKVSIQPQTQTDFYFTSASGKVTKITAMDKEAAENMYRNILIPFMWYPVYCWIPKERCDNRHCDTMYGHSLEHIRNNFRDHCRHQRYIEVYQKLLKQFPNCDILQRLKIMYYETPSISEDDYQTTVQNTDGTITKHMPASLVIHWRKANVRFKTKYVQYDDKYSWFSEFLASCTEMNRGLLANHCFYIIIYQIDKITPDQIDKLSGSIQASTEPPVEQTLATEIQDFGHTPTRRGFSDRLRRRPQYEPIEFQQVGIR